MHSRHGDLAYGGGNGGGNATGDQRELLALGRLTVRLAEAGEEWPVSRLFQTGRVSGGRPSQGMSGGKFMVAEGRGEALAAMFYRTSLGRLVVGPLAVDTLVVEYRFAMALYTGAASLAQSLGKREAWVESDEHREYLLQAGYRRRIGGWRLDVAPHGNNEDVLAGSGGYGSPRASRAADLAFFRPFWGF